MLNTGVRAACRRILILALGGSALLGAAGAAPQGAAAKAPAPGDAATPAAAALPGDKMGPLITVADSDVVARLVTLRVGQADELLQLMRMLGADGDILPNTNQALIRAAPETQTWAGLETAYSAYVAGAAQRAQTHGGVCDLAFPGGSVADVAGAVGRICSINVVIDPGVEGMRVAPFTVTGASAPAVLSLAADLATQGSGETVVLQTYSQGGGAPIFRLAGKGPPASARQETLIITVERPELTEERVKEYAKLLNDLLALAGGTTKADIRLHPDSGILLVRVPTGHLSDQAQTLAACVFPSAK